MKGVFDQEDKLPVRPTNWLEGIQHRFPNLALTENQKARLKKFRHYHDDPKRTVKVFANLGIKLELATEGWHWSLLETREN